MLADGAAFGDDGFAITQIRLAQSIVERRLPLTGQAIAYDCCSEDPPATDPESGAKSNAGSCNLHPQDKACPATRHHHSCVGGNPRFVNFAGAASIPRPCRDGSVAAPEARGWCIEGNCRPISAKTHVYDVGSRPWALPRLANATTSNRARKFLENLIERMTAADPDARPTLTEALDLLAAKRPHIT